MKSIFIYTFLLASCMLSAQDAATVAAAKRSFETHQYKPSWKISAAKPKNEVQIMFSGLFLFYKHFVSSQDGGKCNFSPTCSEYSLLSIQKHGLIFGTLATLDRLIRCNPMSPELYETDHEGHTVDKP